MTESGIVPGLRPEVALGGRGSNPLLGAKYKNPKQNYTIMSNTLRLHDYKRGKPVYTTHVRRDHTYHFWRHEHPVFRRHFNRSKRMRMKQYFRRTREVQNIGNTNGWETW
jgi:hypothetical protein